MPVINFPSPLLTREDEETIAARVVASGYHSCRRVTRGHGEPAMALLNRARKIRGYVTKKHGVYAVLDARGTVVAESRKLDDVMSVLLK